MFLYICGKAWAKTIPCWAITIRGRKYGINIDKPWTQKEQMFSNLVICNLSRRVLYSLQYSNAKTLLPFCFLVWLPIFYFRYPYNLLDLDLLASLENSLFIQPVHYGQQSCQLLLSTRHYWVKKSMNLE
nr:AEL_HP1_G0057140.mRNA.1.CDS.1 [Saccharomyces cerevisiae]